jgi:hypothetical protein
VALYRASIESSYSDGTELVNVLHYHTEVAPLGDEPDPSDVAANIWTNIGDNYKKCLHPDVTVHQVVLVQVEVGSGLPASGSFSVEEVGTNPQGGSTVPRAQVMILKKNTGVALRSARGWVELPFCPKEDNISGQNWAGAAIGHAADLCDNLAEAFTIGSLPSTTVKPIVWSKTRYLAGLTPTSFDINTFSPQLKVHWLRSRTTSP